MTTAARVERPVPAVSDANTRLRQALATVTLRPMLERSAPILFTVAIAMSLLGCKDPGARSGHDANTGDAAPSPDKQAPAETPKNEPPALPEPDPLPPEVDLSGVTAPEVSTVFFSVEGAMIPMACFDRGAKKIKAGNACLRLVADGATVFLASESGRMLDTVEGKRNALCEVKDTPTSLSTPGLASGNTYTYGAYPKALGRSVSLVPASSESDRATEIDDALRDVLMAAVKASNPRVKSGRLRVTQRATHDLDGDGVAEEFVSVVVTREDNADKGLFSGLFRLSSTPGGAPTLIEQGKGLDVIRIRGSLDLDGDKTRELWLGLAYDGGNADRIYIGRDGGYDAVGAWTCGA